MTESSNVGREIELELPEGAGGLAEAAGELSRHSEMVAAGNDQSLVGEEIARRSQIHCRAGVELSTRAIRKAVRTRAEVYVASHDTAVDDVVASRTTGERKTRDCRASHHETAILDRVVRAAVQRNSHSIEAGDNLVPGREHRVNVSATRGAGALQEQALRAIADREHIAVECQIDRATRPDSTGAAGKGAINESTAAADTLREHSVSLGSGRNDIADLREADRPAVTSVSTRDGHMRRGDICEHSGPAPTDGLQEHAVSACAGRRDIAIIRDVEITTITARAC